MKESEYKALALRQWKLIYTLDMSKEDAIWTMHDEDNKNYYPWSGCFACEYVMEKTNTRLLLLDCSLCPITWHPTGHSCADLSITTAYTLYTAAKTARERKLTAYEVYRTIKDTWKVKKPS